MPTISPSEIDSATNWIFLDTRPETEFGVSHIPGARRIGYMPREAHVLEGLDKDQPIVVYCTVGWRSSKVGAWLMTLGFTRVYNLYGGIIVWANAGGQLHDPKGIQPGACMFTVRILKMAEKRGSRLVVQNYYLASFSFVQSVIF
ncbi:MAG: rhodanese-like domain-containing protein [Bacteroidia bacterium]